MTDFPITVISSVVWWWSSWIIWHNLLINSVIELHAGWSGHQCPTPFKLGKPLKWPDSNYLEWIIACSLKAVFNLWYHSAAVFPNLLMEIHHVTKRALKTFKKKNNVCCVTTIAHELLIFSILVSRILLGRDPCGWCHNYCPFECRKFRYLSGGWTCNVVEIFVIWSRNLNHLSCLLFFFSLKFSNHVISVLLNFSLIYST